MRFQRDYPARLAYASMCLLPFCATSVTAQEGGGDFLGTVTLGESKREVQTDTATPVTIIDQEEIDDRQAGTIAELIDSVPGVNLVNGSTPQGSGINIRGFGANNTFGTDQKVAVVVDGALVSSEEIYRIGTQLFTDPELFKSVRVQRGTVGSFEYASGIIGGLVELETKDASDFTGGEIGFRVRQSLQAASNGNGLTSSTILAWQPTPDLEFLAQYIWRDQDLQNDGDGNTIGNSAFNLPSWMAKAKYTFGENRNHSLTFKLSETNTDEQDVPYDTFLVSDDFFGNVDREVNSQTASLRYQFSPMGNDLINLDVTLSYANQEINQEYVPGSSSCEGGPPFPCGFPFPPTGLDVVNADHEYETTRLAIRNTSFFTTGAVNHDLRTGIEFIRRERLDAASASGGTDDRIAVYAVNDMKIGEAWTISPALRYETSEIEGSTAPNNGRFENEALMGGLSVRYAFANGFAVFASAAYTESLPIIDDLNTPRFMTQPEKSRTYELGASYDSEDVFASGDTLAIKANLYTTDIWDITSYTIPGSASEFTDEVATEGLELEASYAMQSGFYIDLNANIARGEAFDDTIGHYPWGNTPADTARLTVGQKFGDELDLSWEMVVAARMDDIVASEEPSPGFGIHNLRATYIPQSGILEDTEIRLGIENLFDKSYTPRLSTRPAVGRNIKLTLAKTF